MIDGSAVKHIEDRHGINGAHDSTMQDDSDLARMQYVLNNFDRVMLLTDENGQPVLSTQFRDKNNRPAQMVRFEKKVNGTYYVVEATPDSADQKLHIASVYMQKKAEASPKN